MKALSLGGAAALRWVAVVPAAEQVAPPAGDYRGDSEITVTTHAGLMVMGG